jgi:hypothetical protein
MALLAGEKSERSTNPGDRIRFEDLMASLAENQRTRPSTFMMPANESMGQWATRRAICGHSVNNHQDYGPVVYSLAASQAMMADAAWVRRRGSSLAVPPMEFMNGESSRAAA